MNLIGWVDCVNEFELGGWAVNKDNQKDKLFIDIIINDEFIGSCKACSFRKDVKDTGISEDGYVGFYFNPRGCMKEGKNSVRILYSGTETLLNNGQSVFELLSYETRQSKKENRLREYILPMLQCITCGSDSLVLSEQQLSCNNCHQKHIVYNHIPLMTLDPEAAINYSKNIVSEHIYSYQWRPFIQNSDNEPVLDFGSGNNPDFFSNLIKFDIFPFPNVDVVGNGDILPFKPNTFKTVISDSVFEHLKDPFTTIDNIRKIMKPNSEIYIETAFLQPIHAYPNHYFNMSKYGLEVLCSSFSKINSGVRPHQFPSFTLTWLLKSWANKLTDEQKDDFLKASIQEIIDEYTSNIYSKRWMENFSVEDIEEMSVGSYFHGKKPEI